MAAATSQLRELDAGLRPGCIGLDIHRIIVRWLTPGGRTDASTVGTTERRVLRELGSKIRTARLAVGLTQEAVAAECGIDYKRYQRLEQGAVNPTIRTLHRIARALDLDLWRILGSGGPGDRGD